MALRSALPMRMTDVEVPTHRNLAPLTFADLGIEIRYLTVAMNTALCALPSRMRLANAMVFLYIDGPANGS